MSKLINLLPAWKTRRAKAMAHREQAKQLGFTKTMAKFLRNSPEERKKCVAQAAEELAGIDSKIESEKTTIAAKLEMIAQQESLIKEHKQHIFDASSTVEVLSNEVAEHRRTLEEAENDKKAKKPKKELMAELAEDPTMYKYATFSTFEDIQKDTKMMSHQNVVDETPTHAAMDDLLGRLITDGLEQFKGYKKELGPIRVGHGSDDLSLRQTYVCSLLDITIFTDEEEELAKRKRRVASYLSDGDDDNDENDEKPPSKKAKTG